VIDPQHGVPEDAGSSRGRLVVCGAGQCLLLRQFVSVTGVRRRGARVTPGRETSSHVSHGGAR